MKNTRKTILFSIILLLGIAILTGAVFMLINVDSENQDPVDDPNSNVTDTIDKNDKPEVTDPKDDPVIPDDNGEQNDPVVPDDNGEQNDPVVPDEEPKEDNETNTQPAEPVKRTVEGSHTWSDDNNRDGIRPQSIVINLFADGTKILSKEITSADKWTWCFEDLDSFKDEKEIIYTVTIENINGYTTSAEGYNTVGSHVTEKVSISGSATWDDDNNKENKRPDSIKINFNADGQVLYYATVKAEHGWAWHLDNLPKYRDGGTEIKYSVTVDKIDNYITSIDGYNITNTLVRDVPVSPPEQSTPEDTEKTNEPEIDINVEIDNFVKESEPAQITMLKPVASGTLTKENEYAIIDYSNTQDGYIMIKYKENTSSKLKVQMKGPTTTYTYNITVGEWTVFPFSDGNGEYAIRVFKNVVDNKYSTVLSLKHTVSLDDEFAPFIRPNQYVNYENAQNSINTAASLLTDDMPVLKKVEIIYNYITNNISYDYSKSATVQSGYLPDLDKVLKEKKGICFDYASLMTGMLRSQNIPCKLIVGYADQDYHAWISVWSPETGWIDNAIFFNGINWQIMDPTFAAGGIQDFEKIVYTTKYIY